jgi:hypothetical protein
MVSGSEDYAAPRRNRQPNAATAIIALASTPAVA